MKMSDLPSRVIHKVFDSNDEHYIPKPNQGKAIEARLPRRVLEAFKRPIMTTPELAKQLGIASKNVTGLLLRFVSAGLVQRLTNEKTLSGREQARWKRIG